MVLFIDTNIYLSFYHLTSDDLEELRKLILLCKQKRVKLLLPKQVLCEFQRNRENKIFEAIKVLKEQQLNPQFPQICRQYPEYNQLTKLQKEYMEIYKKLLDNIFQDEKTNALLADKILSELFACAENVTENDDIISKAKDRFDRGNPPGKEGSYGDAIIWESVLSVVPTGEDIAFISDDKDFLSILNPDEMREYLVKEWEQNKQSHIEFYRRLSQFTDTHFPEIKLSTEYEKELLINDLLRSGSFAYTHKIIGNLRTYIQFTDEQIKRLLSAAIINSQVNSIINDPDVKKFYLSQIEKYVDKFSFDETMALSKILISENDEEERIINSLTPF
jgi:hypothetical protein